MAEVRCPMCSKMNPADAEVCRFCKSRLKPLRPNAGQGDDAEGMKGPSKDDQGDVPDWLSKIRDRSRDETSSASDLFGQDDLEKDSESDWLSGLQAGGESEQGESAGEDWLSRLGSEPAASSRPEAAGNEDVDLTSWLSEIEAEDSTSQPTPGGKQPEETPLDDWSALGRFSTDEPADPASAASDEDDWMKNLSGWQQDQPPGATEEGPVLSSGQDQPQSWDFREQAPQSPPPTSGDDTLDWLRGLEPPSEDVTEQDLPPAAGSGLSTGSFFASEEPAADAGLTGGSGDNVPDWMKAFDTPSESAPAETPAQDDFSPWASFTHSQESPDRLQPEDAAEASSEQAEEIPDWLRSMPAAPAEEPRANFDQDQTPDWLRGGLETPTAAQGSSEADAAGDAIGLPDWLQADHETLPVSETPPGFEEPQTASAGLPDWFSTFDEDRPAAVEPIDAVEASAEGAPEWLGGLSADAAGMESLADEDEVLSEQPLTSGGTGPLPFTEESMPDWLEEFKSQEEPQPSMYDLTPANSLQPVDATPFDVDLPDWLNEESAQERAVAGQPDSPIDEMGAGEQLDQAELPSWVQAMRPVETVMSGEVGMVDSDQRVERVGPLAGMRGVLAAEESVTHYRKPPIYSVKLRVSEKQRNQISQLDTVLARETQQKAVAQTASHAPWIIQRVLVGLLMLVVLTYMMMSNIRIFEVPTLVPQEVANMYQQVDSLQAGDTVLLAVDYEPAFSGEMRFASIQFIDHLMKKQVRVAIVSTVPTGPALANELLATAGRQNSDYNLQDNVENLGYLPGGTISLLEFARNPSRAAPGSRNGADAWASSPVLNGITGLQNFSRVVVLTDRAEIGRSWVEQVQPFLGNVPLLMVSSAQAGPMLEPYVHSGQVQGMVSGLMGGTLYGQWAGSNDPNAAPLRFWGAYQVGLLMAFMFVLTGSIFSAITGQLKPKPRSKDARQKEVRQRQARQKGKA